LPHVRAAGRANSLSKHEAARLTSHFHIRPLLAKVTTQRRLSEVGF
jgi:hypothetical protein